MATIIDKKGELSRNAQSLGQHLEANSVAFIRSGLDAVIRDASWIRDYCRVFTQTYGLNIDNVVTALDKIRNYAQSRSVVLEQDEFPWQLLRSFGLMALSTGTNGDSLNGYNAYHLAKMFSYAAEHLDDHPSVMDDAFLSRPVIPRKLKEIMIAYRDHHIKREQAERDLLALGKEAASMLGRIGIEIYENGMRIYHSVYDLHACLEADAHSNHPMNRFHRGAQTRVWNNWKQLSKLVRRPTIDQIKHAHIEAFSSMEDIPDKPELVAGETRFASWLENQKRAVQRFGDDYEGLALPYYKAAMHHR